MSFLGCWGWAEGPDPLFWGAVCHGGSKRGVLGLP